MGIRMGAGGDATPEDKERIMRIHMRIACAYVLLVMALLLAFAGLVYSGKISIDINLLLQNFVGF